MTRLKIASATLLAMAALASAGVVAAGAARFDAPNVATVVSRPRDRPMSRSPPPSPTTSQASLTVEARDLVTDAPIPGRASRIQPRPTDRRKSPQATDASGTARFSRQATSAIST